MSENASTFTAKFVQSARPRRDVGGAPQYTEYRDAISPLRLAVQASGHRSFVMRYRRPSDGKPAKMTLTETTLASARHAALNALEKIEHGVDPSPRRTARDRADDDHNADAVEVMFASFLELHARRKNRRSTAWANERIFNRLVLPAWRGRSVHDIKRRDVIDLVEHVATDRPYLANRCLGVLSKFFNWLVARDVLAASPVAGVERPHREEVRSRTLTDAELRALWLACEGDGPFGQALRMLILTGARRNEVGHMLWSEVDAERRLWILPAARSKNRREHAVPLSSQAWDLIRAMPRLADCDYVFSANGRGPINGWAKVKSRLSCKAGIAEDGWRIHDLRRSCASGMQRLGISVPVVERALNHASGVFRGIVSTYQTHDYADEVRVALQRWGDHVERIVRPADDVVVPMRAARRTK